MKISLNMVNWFIRQEGRIDLGYLGEGPIEIEINVDNIVDDYNYYLDFDSDTIPLEKGERSLDGLIPQAVIERSGSMALQVRASNKDSCKKSNVIYGYLRDGVNAEYRYTDGLPTEFAVYEEKIRSLCTELEKKVEEKVETVAEPIVQRLLDDMDLPGMVKQLVEEGLEPGQYFEEYVKPYLESAIADLTSQLRDIADEEIEDKVPPMIDEAIKDIVAKADDARATVKRVKNMSYLYEIEYNRDYDYDKMEYFFRNSFPDGFGGGCSGAQLGKYRVRNFDYPYSEAASFVVHSKVRPNQLESIGVMGGFRTVSKKAVDSGEYLPAYDWIPYVIVDGINSAGVCVQLNVVEFEGSGSKPRTTGTNPSAPISVCVLGLPRYILDNISDISSAEVLKNQLDEINIWCKDSGHIAQYELHMLVSNKDKCYLVEFWRNSVSVKELMSHGHPDYTNYPVMTNFYQRDIEFEDSERKRFYPTEIKLDSINVHACGLERFIYAMNYIYEHTCDYDWSINDAKELAKSLRYTNTYTKWHENPSTGEEEPDLDFWWTELASHADPSVGWPGATTEECLYEDPVTHEKKSKVYNYAKIAHDGFPDRTREDATYWQTIHSSIYDTEKCKMRIYTQEDYTHCKDYELDFPLN